MLALLLVLVSALVGRAWYTSNQEEQQAGSSTTATQEPTTEPETTTTQEETPSKEPISPAPEGSQDLTELRSPTGNIVCKLSEDTASCSVLERNFEDSSLEDCEAGPFSIQVAAGDAALDCGSSFLSDSAQTLEYEDSAVHGDMACTSRFDGMTCWNTMTGKGFTVSRSMYETF